MKHFRKSYYNNEWYEYSNKIKHRDNYKCLRCGRGEPHALVGVLHQQTAPAPILNLTYLKIYPLWKRTVRSDHCTLRNTTEVKYTHASIGKDEDTTKAWAWCYLSNCIYFDIRPTILYEALLLDYVDIVFLLLFRTVKKGE